MALDNEIVNTVLSPKVSVIIPVYNVEKYLRECLDSIVNQSLRDIEIICVNDCTPDKSQEILDEYAAQDSRFILLKHEQNKGLSGTRNTGLARAKGGYIYFIDSDDFLACNDALESLYDIAIVDEADETVGGILKWNEDTGEKYLDWHKNYLEKEIHGQPLIKLPQLWANVIGVNKLLRNSFLEDHGICFNENIRKHEDNPFSVQVHILAQKISIITKTTYIYRQVQSGSIMSTARKSDSYHRCIYCYDIFNFIEADKSRHKFRKMYYPMYSRQLIGSAEILSKFSPDESEKTELFHNWKKIVDLLPNNFPETPPRQRQVFEHIKKGEMQQAWTNALDFSQQTVKKRAINATRNDDTPLQKHASSGTLQNTEQFKKQLARLKNLNEALSGQIDVVYNSYSWRITAPLRLMLKRLRGY